MYCLWGAMDSVDVIMIIMASKKIDLKKYIKPGINR